MLEQKRRMNFLRRGPVQFTYRHLVLLLALWIVLLSVIGGVQQLRAVYAKHGIDQARRQVKEFSEEKDKHIAIAQMYGGARDPRSGLRERLLHAPRWSVVLDQLARSTPSQLRLMSITATGDQKGGGARMDIKGVGTSVRSVTDYIMRLEASPVLRDVELVGTERKRGDRNFTFEIAAIVLAARR